MKDINLDNGYIIKRLNLNDKNIISNLYKKCLDYCLMHYETIDINIKDEIDNLFFSLPPNKEYKDKFVLGIFDKLNKLVGIIDIVKNFPKNSQWIIGLMLIEPKERNKNLGKTVHKIIVDFAITLGANSFRVGVINENTMGKNFWTNLGYKKIKEVNMNFKQVSKMVNVMTLKF